MRTSKRTRKYTDHKYNIALVCLVCHGFAEPNDVMYRHVDSPEFRRDFMNIQLGRYGYDKISAWLHSFPDKARLSDRWEEAVNTLVVYRLVKDR